MKNLIIPILFACIFFSCKEDVKASMSDIDEKVSEVIEEKVDSVIDVVQEPIKKSAKQVKEELIAKGFKVFDYVDEKTQDTILMQQYFMAFLKTGPIRVQNEEETAFLQKEHLAHLTKMYELGYADISGPFDDEGDIRGVTIYNVPSLKMADSLANADPMVKAGRLEIEIHPWWAGKGFPLR
ncbi:YciI family protein [Flavivirga jejuensis]|uniref:YciI family protein n=1 Tax=Flavivirga jejuensis TaxID=870487 RepID=A0ABT8WR61_9FLAO|nr:YciI family protein [Flavivirga jejuensis]MDO5975652.1 YciI family protein [Flavivirga jejuensis]